jgi:hypothetical protein
VRSYLVTTSGGSQSLIGVVNNRGTVNAYNSAAFKVAAGTNPLTASGSGTAGVAVSGCASGPCRLAAPGSGAPALYQAGGAGQGPATGLQLKAAAVTGVESLPLQVGSGNAHTLASATLDVTPALAKLVDASAFWPSDTIDTALVSSGELVPAASVPVKGG